MCRKDRLEIKEKDRKQDMNGRNREGGRGESEAECARARESESEIQRNRELFFSPVPTLVCAHVPLRLALPQNSKIMMLLTAVRRDRNYTLSQSLNTSPDRQQGVGRSISVLGERSKLEEKMKKLVTLHQRGHITDGEFHVAKARLLQGKDLQLNAVKSPSVIQEEFLDSSNTIPRNSVQYSVSKDGDSSSLWGTGTGEKFDEDLAPDASKPIYRSSVSASRATLKANYASETMTRGAPVAAFIPLKYVPQHDDCQITDVPVSYAPASGARNALPPPSRSHLSRDAERVDQDQIATRDGARQEWLSERDAALREMEGIVGGPSKVGVQHANATAAHMALAEANRQVEEQKRLLQREQLKLLRVLNGPSGAASHGSPMKEAKVLSTTQVSAGISVEERMRRFLVDDEIQKFTSPSVGSTREKGRVVNLTQPQAKSKDTQFVI